MIFFLDENLQGDTFAQILRAASINVEFHRDHFAPSAPDELWIPEVAQKGWIITTGDVQTRFNIAQVQAIVNSRAQVLHVRTGNNATHPTLARNFVNSFKAIEAFFEQHPPPCVGTLIRPSRQEDFFRGKSGKVDLKKLPD